MMKMLMIAATLGLAMMAAPQAHARPGYHCDARYSRYGRVCPLIRPRPVGAVCHCVPPAPPGHGYLRPVRGVVIR
jgi:hypothetical protein